MTPVLRRPRAVAVAAALALFAVAGCGGGDPPPPGTPSAANDLVTLAKIDEQKPGSPEKALLQWWMDIQYNNLGGYLGGMATPLRHQREADPRTRHNLLLVSGDSIRSQPKVEDSRRNAGTATLYTQVQTRQPVGASRFTTSNTPQAFTLVRENGQWKIVDDAYVLDRATVIREAVEAAAKKKP
jgi:hypothetical protein